MRYAIEPVQSLSQAQLALSGRQLASACPAFVSQVQEDSAAWSGMGRQVVQPAGECG
jgi:hypothetical protein